LLSRNKREERNGDVNQPNALRPTKTRFRRIKQVLWICLFTFAILGLWAFWWEPSRLTVVHQTITVRPWHPEHSGLTVAILSDLHVGSPHRDLSKLKDLVAATNAGNPDLILLLGDFVIQGVVGGNLVHAEPIAAELGGLHAPLGVVAVLGNHDWWYGGERVRRALQSNGVLVLENLNVLLTYRGKSFWLSGLADLWTRGDQLSATLGKIATADPVLVLTHNPDIFPKVPNRISLTLAGHTHGGQVNFPIIGRPIVPSRFGQRYAYGFIEENERKLFVTGGIGTSILPVRFRVTPEIVILRLVRQ
jgi:predicted MPP superfamily phosphohydrolase